jgi:hypothetical protein
MGKDDSEGLPWWATPPQAPRVVHLGHNHGLMEVEVRVGGAVCHCCCPSPCFPSLGSASRMKGVSGMWVRESHPLGWNTVCKYIPSACWLSCEPSPQLSCDYGRWQEKNKQK